VSGSDKSTAHLPRESFLPLIFPDASRLRMVFSDRSRIVAASAKDIQRPDGVSGVSVVIFSNRPRPPQCKKNIGLWRNAFDNAREPFIILHTTSIWRYKMPQSTVNADHEVLMVGEAAARLRCSNTTIRNLIRKGELKALKVGGLIRIPTSEITAACNGELKRNDVPPKK